MGVLFGTATRLVCRLLSGDEICAHDPTCTGLSELRPPDGAPTDRYVSAVSVSLPDAWSLLGARRREHGRGTAVRTDRIALRLAATSAAPIRNNLAQPLFNRVWPRGLDAHP